MAYSSRAASTTLANACRRKFRSLAQRHHPCRHHQLVRIKAPQTAIKDEFKYLSATQKINFFGTSANSGHKNGEDQSSDTKSVPPGQASITLQGGWTEESDDRRPGTKQQESHLELSLFAVPIVIEMPQIDTDGACQDEPIFFVEKWHKFPGDLLEKDDIVCDIATPDFSFGLQIDDEESGIMGEIHAEEGLKVACNAPICTIYHKE